MRDAAHVRLLATSANWQISARHYRGVVSTLELGTEPTVSRRIFPTWWITMPATFEETFVEDEAYWHAWDLRRSISLTSVVVSDRRGRPVSSRAILRRVAPEPGRRINMPPGLDGWAVVITQPPPARADRAISGVIAVKGRVLVATVTADDLEWAEAVWNTIRRKP